MFALQAIILGIIEGLTEFLPISSTGHLIIAEKYMNFEDTAKVFTVVIQLGAILAVFWYYRSDIKQKIAGFFKREPVAVNFIKNLAIAVIPAGILGVALDKKFEKYSTPKVVAAALIVGAVVLWLVDRKAPPSEKEHKLELEAVTSKQALIIGLWQCFALIPGASRSGSSIVGGLLSGLNRVTATGFSFYLGIPVLGLASLYKLVKSGGDLSTVSGGGASIIIGLIVSFIVALVAISWLLKYVSSHSFALFVYYRILLGIVVLALLA
jgi:undecaprenyl-diphosphatase